MGIEIILELSKQYFSRRLLYVAILLAAAAIATIFWSRKTGLKQNGCPVIMEGLPVIGEGAAFQKDAKEVLIRGFKEFGNLNSPSKAFGIHLGPQTHYVLSHPQDLQMMRDDNPYQVYFNIDLFFEVLGAPIFLGKETFATNLVSVFSK